MIVDEDIKDFLIESKENLENLDREIVELERRPQDAKLIAGIFRTIHTIKGTCGFFDFHILGSVTHIAEDLLSQAREKQREVTPELISLVLETVDAVKIILDNIESTGEEEPTFTMNCAQGSTTPTSRWEMQTPGMRLKH